MSSEAPLATLRLTSVGLDARDVAHALLHDDEGLVRSAFQSITIKSRPGVWLASTDNVLSPRPADHLRVLLELFAAGLNELKIALPDTVIDFSLLVFDPKFVPTDLPQSLLSSITEIGILDIEMSAVGRGVTFSANDFKAYAV